MPSRKEKFTKVEKGEREKGVGGEWVRGAYKSGTNMNKHEEREANRSQNKQDEEEAKECGIRGAERNARSTMRARSWSISTHFSARNEAPKAHGYMNQTTQTNTNTINKC